MGKNWSELAENLGDAYTAFVKVASELDAALHNKAGVCGEWSPREVVTHLVGWDAKAVEGLEQFANGHGEYFVFPDIDEFNAQSVDTRQHLSWETALTELETAQQELQAMITLVQHKGLNAESGFGQWLIGRKEDYELHTRQLQAWV
jgi:hypothetical protein